MPTFLIVEDDSFKCEDLAAVISGLHEHATIKYASDVATAVKLLGEQNYDLVVIDMALPSHPTVSGGGSPMSLLNGGLEIIFELNSLGREDDCLVVTQYPEVKIAGRSVAVSDAAVEIKSEFDCDVLACLEYSAQNAGWRTDFINILKRYAHPNP